MPARLSATPPPFEPKKKSQKGRDLLAKPAPKKVQPAKTSAQKPREDSRAIVPKTRSKVVKAPKGAQPAAVKLERVTVGPFFDERHPRSYEGWTVVVMTGAAPGRFVTYHRFREKAEAEKFAAAVGR